MNATSYNEDQTLQRYMADLVRFFITDLEQRALNLAIAREKAKSNDWLRGRLPGWLARESNEVVLASERGCRVIQEQIRNRIEQEHREGKQTVNRCPACGRIAHTPFARQCQWCGHDWHQA
jgi:hypothetical protein